MVAPVTILCSQEQLLVDDALARIKKATEDTLPELNQDVVDLHEHGVATLIEAATTLPMMARQRFVQGRSLDKLRAQDHGALLRYLDAPCPTTVLVLTCSRLDLRSKLGQALKARKLLTILEAPRAAQLPDWIMGRAASSGTTITHRAASRLAGLVGAELGVLAMSLEKLKLYVGEGQGIDIMDVEAVVSHTQEANVFELTGAIGKRDWAVATLRLQQLLQDGEAPLRVLAMVVREVRLLLGAKQSPGRAMDVAHELGIRPFAAERLLADARRFSNDELVGALGKAQMCDATLKSSRLKPDLVLQRLLVELCAV